VALRWSPDPLGGRSLHSSTRNPDQAFGANVAGPAMGDFCEDFSVLLGSHLLLLAALFYLLSRLGTTHVLKAR
jgi:hypothetical protein